MIAGGKFCKMNASILLMVLSEPSSVFICATTQAVPYPEYIEHWTA